LIMGFLSLIREQMMRIKRRSPAGSIAKVA
jgi:hypothetical protein